ncbi:MAG: hypothetical protein NTY02_06405 [Acidobacteria bacterium]|nr:hypothetical protein [Acidobacteriota bacterium]
MTWKQLSGAVAAATIAIGAVLQAQQPTAQAAGGGAQDAVAALKQSIQQGMALVRRYEWVETTIISLKGEEKARQQNRCYYGADGKVQKISLDQAPPPEQDQGGGRGRRGGGKVKEKVVENKKDEMKEYMEKAAALIHQYVPPNPEKIQAAKDAGRVAMNPQAGGAAKMVISQYLLAGDSLTIDLDPKIGKLLGLGVSSFLEKPEDTVTLAVQMNALADGAIYAAQTTLEAKAKNITVVIQNSWYKPVSR